MSNMLEELKAADPDAFQKMMAELLVQATNEARTQLALEQAAEEERKAAEAAERARIRQARAELFSTVQVQIEDLLAAVQGVVEPEEFTRKVKNEDGSEGRESAGNGWKFSGEHSITLGDGSVTMARIDVNIVYGDSKTRRVMSVPAAVVPTMLEGVSA